MNKTRWKAVALLITLVMMLTLTSVSFAEESLDANVETITIKVPTREIAPGVFLLPWEIASDRFVNVDFQTPYNVVEVEEHFAAGPLVEVEIYHVDSLNSISVEQERVVLATDGELFYVIRLFEEITRGTGNKGVKIEIRDYSDTRIYYGEIQVGASFVWDGTYIMGDYADSFCYVVSKPGNSDLAKKGNASFLNNGSTLVTVFCYFNFTRHTGSNVNVGASFRINGSGTMSDVFPTSSGCKSTPIISKAT